MAKISTNETNLYTKNRDFLVEKQIFGGQIHTTAAHFFFFFFIGAQNGTCFLVCKNYYQVNISNDNSDLPTTTNFPPTATAPRAQRAFSILEMALILSKCSIDGGREHVGDVDVGDGGFTRETILTLQSLPFNVASINNTSSKI